MRELLRYEPSVRIATPAELLAFAAALEAESVRRYGHLAEVMRRRGMPAAAATFRALAEDERDHADGVAAWARSLDQPPPDPEAFTWALPREIAESWDDLTDRTRVTPYQALAVAVLNEMRAFAVYSHIAAATVDDGLRRDVERLAAEELGHAALLRRERRRAFRAERREGHTGTRPAGAEDFREQLATLAADAASRHQAIAAALESLGDGDGAALLRAIAADEAALAGTVPAPAPEPAAAPAAGTAAVLLRAALAPSERLSEAMGDAATGAEDESVLQEAQRVQEIAVRHLARLSARLAALERRGRA